MIEEWYTERLHLRPCKEADAPYLFAVWSDPEVAEFMNIEPFSSRDQAVRMIAFMNALAEKGEAIRYSLETKNAGRIIGSCGYNAVNNSAGTVEIGYEIAKAYWRQGYGTEVVSTLVDHAFHRWGMEQVEAKVHPQNEPSTRLLEKLGFIFSGTLWEEDEATGGKEEMLRYVKRKFHD
ncbi:UNVERIFIED_CONTAM: GNAT family N-acetyltransferase [Halobacillus marinus]